MKFLTTLIAGLSAPDTETSVRALLRLVATLVVAVVVFSLGFHALMGLEGRDFSWWSSVYWTLVTMSTLGYGDITFDSDLGRIYSLFVLFAGAILILVMLPFTFIQVIYLPWREATRRASAPRRLPRATSGHVLVAGLEPIGESLIERLAAADVPYALLVDDVEHALALHDAGFQVAVGGFDDPETYRRVHAEQAAMVFTARADTANTNVAFTVREVADQPLVVATANAEDSIDILQLAGCDHVLRLGELLGRAFARRILSPSARSSVIATIEGLVIAEASAAGTELVGRTLAELGLRQRFGLSVVGVWDRGVLQTAVAHRRIEESSILLLAGTPEQLAAYDATCLPTQGPDGQKPAAGLVVILGGGRVGRATAAALRAAGTRYRIVEKLAERVRDRDDSVVGDAADRDVLRRAGIDEATAVVVTTHDDDMNLYLTLYCRRLRPHALVLGRVTLERNLSTMYRAGADFVLSYASTGAAEAWNTLRQDSTLLLTEGLVVFRVPTPPALVGRTLRELDLPATTGCQVVAIVDEAEVRTTVDVGAPLAPRTRLVLIGTEDGEKRFLRRFVAGRRPALAPWRRRRR